MRLNAKNAGSTVLSFFRIVRYLLLSSFTLALAASVCAIYAAEVFLADDPTQETGKRPRTPHACFQSRRRTLNPCIPHSFRPQVRVGGPGVSRRADRRGERLRVVAVVRHSESRVARGGDAHHLLFQKRGPGRPQTDLPLQRQRF